MKKYLLLSALFFATFYLAQKTTVHPPSQKTDPILAASVIPPTFPEGNEAFTRLLNSTFIIENIDCSVNGIQKTIIDFVVERDGSITEVKTTGSNASLNKEAIRTVKAIRQKWNPGTLDGKNVRVRFKQPFKLVCE